tara:strand:- start:195 stop:398 length:204 start_codon:yes stop_codon:yes gene_type:complete
MKKNNKTEEYLEGFALGRDIRINGKSEFYLQNITKLKFKDQYDEKAQNFEDGLYEGYKSITSSNGTV